MAKIWKYPCSHLYFWALWIIIIKTTKDWPQSITKFFICKIKKLKSLKCFWSADGYQSHPCSTEYLCIHVIHAIYIVNPWSKFEQSWLWCKSEQCSQNSWGEIQFENVGNTKSWKCCRFCSRNFSLQNLANHDIYEIAEIKHSYTPHLAPLHMYWVRLHKVWYFAHEAF